MLLDSPPRFPEKTAPGEAWMKLDRNALGGRFLRVTLAVASMTLFCPLSTTCSGPDYPGEINVKRDFEFVYDVIEYSFLTMVEHIRINQKDRGLDLIQEYVESQQPELENVGKRLNAIILSEEEAQEIVRFNQRYDALHTQHVDYLEANLSPEQKDRFVDLVVDGIANRLISQLTTPQSSTEFFSRVFR